MRSKCSRPSLMRPPAALRSSPPQLQQPTARLLVADARFRALRHTGQSEAAYGVYLDLLNDPALGDRAAALRQVIYDRWAAELGPGDDPAAFPPAARLGVADISRRRGLAARAAGDDAAAVVALKRAVRAAAALADDPDAPPALIAAGRYQRAYANSILQPRNLAVLLEAINEATAVARDHAALPVATDAITLASSLAESLHRGHAERPGVTPAFLATAQVLFDSGQFDTTRAADDRRLYATRVRLQDAAARPPALRRGAEPPSRIARGPVAWCHRGRAPCDRRGGPRRGVPHRRGSGRRPRPPARPRPRPPGRGRA